LFDKKRYKIKDKKVNETKKNKGKIRKVKEKRDELNEVEKKIRRIK